MNQHIATTPEQSKRLLACGVDPSFNDRHHSFEVFKKELHANLEVCSSYFNT